MRSLVTFPRQTLLTEQDCNILKDIKKTIRISASSPPLCMPLVRDETSQGSCLSPPSPFFPLHSFTVYCSGGVAVRGAPPTPGQQGQGPQATTTTAISRTLPAGAIEAAAASALTADGRRGPKVEEDESITEAREAAEAGAVLINVSGLRVTVRPQEWTKLGNGCSSQRDWFVLVMLFGITLYYFSRYAPAKQVEAQGLAH